RAAAERLPASTMRTNVSIGVNRSAKLSLQYAEWSSQFYGYSSFIRRSLVYADGPTHYRRRLHPEREGFAGATRLACRVRAPRGARRLAKRDHARARGVHRRARLVLSRDGERRRAAVRPAPRRAERIPSRAR